MAKKENKMENGELKEINLSLIDENPDNEAIFNMDQKEIEDLANSIKKNGQIEPIIVFAKPDKRFEIVSGHRRKRAVALLGYKTITCIVRPMPDEVLKRKILVLSNTDTRKLTPMDMARAISFHEESLRRQYNIKASKSKEHNIVNELAAEFGISPATVFRYKNLLSVSPEIQAMVERGELNWRTAAECAKLSDNLQKEIANDYTLELSTKMKIDIEATPSISPNRAAGILSSYQALMNKNKAKKSKVTETVVVQKEPEPEEEVITEQQFFENNFEYSSFLTPEEKKISADSVLEDAFISIDKLSDGEFTVEDKEKCLDRISFIEKELKKIKKQL